LSVPFLNHNPHIARALEDVTDCPQFFDNWICMVGAIIPTLQRMQKRKIRNVTIIDRKEATREELDFGTFIPIEKTNASQAAFESDPLPVCRLSFEIFNPHRQAS
jgi:hypothetical protein